MDYQLRLPFERPVRISITGRFRRGKDTLADLIEDELRPEPNFGSTVAPPYVQRLAFAADLKKELAQMTYVMLKKSHNMNMAWLGGEEFELFLQGMNEERAVNGVGWQWWGQFRRSIRENYWLDSDGFQTAFRQAQAAGKHMLVTDMRHHNEAKWCRDNGFYRIRVSGPCRAEGETRDANHPSERYIDELEVDVEYDNIGTVSDMQVWVGLVLLPYLRKRGPVLGELPVVRR